MTVLNSFDKTAQPRLCLLYELATESGWLRAALARWENEPIWNHHDERAKAKMQNGRKLRRSCDR